MPLRQTLDGLDAWPRRDQNRSFAIAEAPALSVVGASWPAANAKASGEVGPSPHATWPRPRPRRGAAAGRAGVHPPPRRSPRGVPDRTWLPDKAVVKLSSASGATAGLSVLRLCPLRGARHMPASATARAATIAATPALPPRTALRRRRQTQRWPWCDFAPLQDRALDELRRECGIIV